MDYIRDLLFSRAVTGSRIVLEADKEYRGQVLVDLARALLLAGHTPIYIQLSRISTRMSLRDYLGWWWRSGYELIAPREAWGSSFGEEPTIAILDDFEYYVEYPSIYGPLVDSVWNRAYVVGVEPGYSEYIDSMAIPGGRVGMARMGRMPPPVMSLVGVSRDVDLVVV